MDLRIQKDLHLLQLKATVTNNFKGKVSDVDIIDTKSNGILYHLSLKFSKSFYIYNVFD